MNHIEPIIFGGEDSPIGLDVMVGRAVLAPGSVSPGAASQLKYVGVVGSIFDSSRKRWTPESGVVPSRLLQGDVEYKAPSDPVLVYVRAGGIEKWLVLDEELVGFECTST